MEYIPFDKFVENINAVSEQKIKTVNHANGHVGIHHAGKSFPISINESEFNFMHDTIVQNNLQKGFELSTGTGISTIGIGRAFAHTGGSLISMDSYYEEDTQLLATVDHPKYSDADVQRIKNSVKAYKFINHIVQLENLPVDLKVGWSPDDVITTLKDQVIDFAFFDCPKSDAEFARDIITIYPFLNKEKFFVFVHDSHTYTDKSFELVKKIFKLEMRLIHHYYKDTIYSKTWKYPMALITNQP